MEDFKTAGELIRFVLSKCSGMDCVVLGWKQTGTMMKSEVGTYRGKKVVKIKINNNPGAVFNPERICLLDSLLRERFDTYIHTLSIRVENIDIEDGYIDKLSLIDLSLPKNSNIPKLPLTLLSISRYGLEPIRIYKQDGVYCVKIGPKWLETVYTFKTKVDALNAISDNVHIRGYLDQGFAIGMLNH